MPYVTRGRRVMLDNPSPLVNQTRDAGDLTYQLTRVVERYRAFHGDRFQTFSDIIGALEQAKDEFQRRVIHPYEDGKILANGDVYA